MCGKGRDRTQASKAVLLSLSSHAKIVPVSGPQSLPTSVPGQLARTTSVVAGQLPKKGHKTLVTKPKKTEKDQACIQKTTPRRDQTEKTHRTSSSSTWMSPNPALATVLHDTPNVRNPSTESPYSSVPSSRGEPSPYMTCKDSAVPRRRHARLGRTFDASRASKDIAWSRQDRRGYISNGQSFFL